MLRQGEIGFAPKRSRARFFRIGLLSAAAIGTLGLSPAWADTAFTYDALGRVKSVTYPSGVVITYQYDAAGNRTQSTKALPVPAAVADAVSTAFNTAKTFDPRANDTDPGGLTLSITAVTAPAHGSVAFTATSITYTPVSTYSGTDSFTYAVTDTAGWTATATVTMTVANGVPVANPDSGSTAYLTPITLDPRGNDSDPNGDALSVSAVGAATHGTTSFTASNVTYSPATGWSGSDSFSYTISDGKGGTASSTVTITTANAVPVANADAISTTLNTAKAFDPRTNDTDANGDTLSVTAVTQPSHGTTSFTATGITYTPTTGYGGTDSFSYTISDGKGGTSSASVTVTVANAAPVANADSITTATSTAKTFDPRTNDTDANGDTLSVTAVSQPSHGTTTFTSTGITYTPTTGYGGTDSFTYTISDGKGGTATATVSVTVSNAVPVANGDSVTTAYNTATTFDPKGNDTDANGDTLSITAVGTPSHGTASFTASNITYTPTSGYSGADSFSYTISDGKGGTASATVSVTVQAQQTITINVTAASNLRTLANNAGYTGADTAIHQFVVPSGTTVMGASTGGAAIDTGTWPAGTPVVLIVSGNVYGGGGAGGAGNSGAGGAGGDAVYAQAPLTITVSAGATVVGGGGGGAGGAPKANGTSGLRPGSGGGGGFPNGAPGAYATLNGYSSVAGSAGTTSGGGAGGVGQWQAYGGNGGNAAAAGAAGYSNSNVGQPGYAIRKNGNTVTVTNSGTITGTAG